jgi:threonine synthase
MKEEKYYFQCNDCGKTYSFDEATYLCPQCEKENTPEKPPKGVLKTLYYYKQLKSKYKKGKLFDKLREKDYLELMPVYDRRNFSYLKVGKTPLYEPPNKPDYQVPYQLFLKDDSQNPTFSFKDRASHLISAFAKEHKLETIVAASTGNAGSSLAGICASQQQKAVIFVPEKAPIAKLTQIMMYGAQIIPVRGTYDNAFDMSIQATQKYGWYNRNTAYNPFTIEGKKTVSYELFRQLQWQIPERVFVPVGDGVIISGVYKGFEDLLKLGIIEKIPTVVMVQSEKSANICYNMNSDEFVSSPSTTIADSIAVDIPRNFYMAKKFLQTYKGEWLTVSDDEILQASQLLSSSYGIFSEPAASAAYAGFIKYIKDNKITENSKNVALLTGSGLKDLKSVQKLVKMPEAVEKI